MTAPLWSQIPAQLQPSAEDMLALDFAIDDIREAVRLRHDFQTTASVEAKERRLAPKGLESDFAKTRRPPPTPKEISDEYQATRQKIVGQLFRVKNKKLMHFLFSRLHMILPDIGMSEKAPLRVLGKDQMSLLGALEPDRPDILIVLLIRHPFITLDGSYYW
jgi:hypothetical protein